MYVCGPPVDSCKNNANQVSVESCYIIHAHTHHHQPVHCQPHTDPGTDINMENDEKVRFLQHYIDIIITYPQLDSWRKNEPKEKEFDASSIVYALIFVLYLILAVVLGVFMYKK